MAYKLNVGDLIPAFTAKDQNGNTITDRQLRGNPFVLYFYPKDGTPGCTTEACDFRDQLQDFEALSARVVGISPDGANDHQKFIASHNLNFTLLCDEGHKIADKFDVWQNNALERTTFVVNPDGIIAWIERRVNVKDHVKRVLQVLQDINKDLPI
jgi:peroxiredoxin Q/BCP